MNVMRYPVARNLVGRAHDYYEVKYVSLSAVPGVDLCFSRDETAPTMPPIRAVQKRVAPQAAPPCLLQRVLADMIAQGGVA